MPVRGTHRLLVVPPGDCDITWSEIGQMLTRDVRRPWTADPHLLVRRRRLAAMLRGSDDLLDVVDGTAGTSVSAGGRLRNLDLPQLGNLAYARARARWWAWKTHVARCTPVAHPWESFLVDHQQRPDALSVAQARRRFEAQPRVLAMLALNSHPAARFRFDPDEVAAYQAGEVVYTTIGWQTAVVGDALVDPDGHLHRHDAVALADRLRHLRAATDLVHRLTPDRYLAVVRATLGPFPTGPSAPTGPTGPSATARPTAEARPTSDRTERPAIRRVDATAPALACGPAERPAVGRN